MARQEEIFAQTIMDMKRAMQRRSDDSEADDFIQKPTNRGNKRKRGAKYVQEGRLDLANPVKQFKRPVNFNGYMRGIISKNSLRVDPDGDVFGDGDVDSTIELSDYDEDPYKDVRVEELLMPLTSAGALKDHPTMSIPYTSRALDEIIHSAQEMVQREQNNLWRLKQLTNGLRGDATFMPCGTFETDIDAFCFEKATDSAVQLSSSDSQTDLALTVSIGSGMDGVEAVDHHADEEAGGIGEVSEITKADGHDEELERGIAREDHDPDANVRTDMNIDDDRTRVGEDQTMASDGANSNSDAKAIGQNKSDGQTDDNQQPDAREIDPDETMELEDGQEDADGDDEDNQPQHRMTTRAKAAEAVSSPTLSSTSDDDLPPHPFFLLAQGMLPSRDLGLPPNEAAETRKLMSAFVQKQEDAVRNSWKLLNGLLKAKRYRDTVLEWCTAEAHVGEMSDGEDWYDREFWGLEGELKKGVEEQEGEGEETGVGGRKKTRRARAAAA